MEAVFLKILNMSISAGWLITIVFVLRLLFQKAPKSFNYILWTLVAIRLVCPFTIESVFSLVPSAETVPSEIMYSYVPEVQTGIEAVDTVINPTITEHMAPEIGASVNPMQIVTYAASVFWLVGIVGMFLYMGISYLMLRWKVRVSMHLQENVWICDAIDSPFIMGVIRPRIYLHSSIEEEQIPYIVAHEKEHLKYRDYLWKPFGFVILAIHWFNPLVWLSYIYMCRDMEMACDERVIRRMDTDEKKMYSNVLLACSAKKRVMSACPVAFGEVGVKQRIKSVVNYKKPAFWFICVAIVACVVAGVCFLTNPKEDTKSSYEKSQGRLPEGPEVYFQYKSDVPPGLASVTLNTLKQTYKFNVSPLSSQTPHSGSYEIIDDRLILKGSGTDEFIFYVGSNFLVFDKENSAYVPRYKYFPDGKEVYYDSVPDKAKFEYISADQRAAIHYLSVLFGSDEERYQNYLTASGGKYTPLLTDSKFLERSYNQAYINMYSKYCTENALSNMQTQGLFTIVDYFANMANSVASLKDVEFIPQEVEIKLKNSESYYFVATLTNTKDGEKKEFQINGQIGLRLVEDGWKVSFIWLNDYMPLSIFVTGKNIYASSGDIPMGQKAFTKSSRIKENGVEKIRIHATEEIEGKEYECGIEFPLEYADKDKREHIKNHVEYYVKTENVKLGHGYVDLQSEDTLWVWIQLFDDDIYEQTGSMDDSGRGISFYIQNWDDFNTSP